MRRFTALVAVVLIALVPIRGLASQLAILCQQGSGGAAVQAHEHDGAGHGDHQSHPAHEDGPAGSEHGCGFCTKQCSSASVAIPISPPALSLTAPSAAIPFEEIGVAGFVPEHPDPPPLAS